MQFIMNNRLYDSASSTMIGENWNGKTGLTCYCETLYRKDNGEYWLHIVGGAMTSLARCEHNLDAETYISIWGTPEE